MVFIEKHYFALNEVAKRWGVRKRDLAYMAENDLLRTSVHLVGVHLERGHVEHGRGQESRIPSERTCFTGLLDLMMRDAFLVFHGGQAQIAQFLADGDEYAALTEPTGPITLKAKHLVIRRCERDRIEALHGRAGNTVAEGIAFQHADGYRSVRLGDLQFALGPLQARVIQHLHQSATSGEPWCSGKAVLANAGATSARMSDVFKSQPRWQDLIESDRRGRYRLRLKTR